MRPSAELDQNLSDGIVAEKVFVEQLESAAQHSQEVLDEDDAFLGSAAQEVWEYDIVDTRKGEFEAAIADSDLVIEFDVIDPTETSADEVTAPLDSRSVYPAEGRNGGIEVTSSGSGQRAGDDGPAGMPTGDPSAGDLHRGERSGVRTAEVFKTTEGNSIDELSLTDAADPNLGLTNRGNIPAKDWAANAGPTRNSDWSPQPKPPASKKRAPAPRAKESR
ncbi:MAG TPA: hypothetical protein VGN17_10560 [Bryobacteraceae bacterium]|jgi:hypothetical protein